MYHSCATLACPTLGFHTATPENGRFKYNNNLQCRKKMTMKQQLKPNSVARVSLGTCVVLNGKLKAEE